MPVTDFELRSIDAERFSEKGMVRKNIRVDHNSSVTQMKPIGKGTTEVSFRFTANYAGMGRIEIEGKIKYEGGGKDLAINWRKTNKMPNQVANEIHSTILSNCIPESVMIARDLQLPPPIPLPKVNIPSEEEGKKPAGGMEVA